jgi:hypothetical protein
VAAAPPQALAKKKKAAPSSSSDSEVPGEKREQGAAQSGDTERPRPIVDPEGDKSEAPRPDAEGNVNFGGNKSAKGKITVKAPREEKIKVYLEGRYFGVAPQTVKKVPPGDYIVELIFPGGKRVSRPVSVAGDEETTIEIGGAAPAEADKAKEDPAMTEAEAEKRWKLAKIVGIASVSALVLGLAFGTWEYMVQKDYDKLIETGGSGAAFQEQVDDLAAKGDRLALAANGFFILAGVGIAATIIIGYPAYKARKAGRRPEGTVLDNPDKLSFMLAPTPNGGGMAGLALRF